MNVLSQLSDRENGMRWVFPPLLDLFLAQEKLFVMNSKSESHGHEHPMHGL